MRPARRRPASPAPSAGDADRPATQSSGAWTTPNRYVAVTTVLQDGKVGGSIRNPLRHPHHRVHHDNGFLLNGKRVPTQRHLRPPRPRRARRGRQHRALERQLEILKEMGCNAIRTSHNPPAPELLDLATAWAWS